MISQENRLRATFILSCCSFVGSGALIVGTAATAPIAALAVSTIFWVSVLLCFTSYWALRSNESPMRFGLFNHYSSSGMGFDILSLLGLTPSTSEERQRLLPPA